MIKLRPDEFKIIAQYIHSLCGVHLDNSKGYLIENRLSGLAEENGCSTFSELYFKARSDPARALPRKIVDAITTGETHFFRDSLPFELLRHKILPELIDRGNRKGLRAAIPIRILSAACSTGQELYSIAILLKEMLVDLSHYNLRLVGVDISNQAIAYASRGVYNRIEVERGLPADKLERYFTRQENQWKIRDEIRAMATFRAGNLLEELNGLGTFDIIFCRNVAIYFSDEDRCLLFKRIARMLDPDGALVIGATESITGICQTLEPRRYLRSVFYQVKTP